MKLNLEEKIVLAFGSAKVAFKKVGKEYQKDTEKQPKDKEFQTLSFGDKALAFFHFNKGQKLQVSPQGDILILKDETSGTSYIYVMNEAEVYNFAVNVPTVKFEFHCGGGVLLAVYSSHKALYYKGMRHQLFLQGGNFLTVEISKDDKIFVTDSAQKSCTYLYDRYMQQMLIIG